MNKKLMFAGIGVVLLLGFLIAVFIADVDVTATIPEAFNVTTIAVDFSGFPGETISQNIAIDNFASVPLNAQFTWTELTNPNGVIYTTTLPLTISLPPGANLVTVNFTYDGASPVGNVTGTIDVDRV